MPVLLVLTISRKNIYDMPMRRSNHRISEYTIDDSDDILHKTLFLFLYITLSCRFPLYINTPSSFVKPSRNVTPFSVY